VRCLKVGWEVHTSISNRQRCWDAASVQRLLPLATGAVVGAVIAAVGSVLVAPPAAKPSSADRHTALSASHPTEKADVRPTGDIAVAEQVQQAERAVIPDAQVGLDIFDRHSDTVLTSVGAGQQFPSMSVVKVLIALDILDSNGWALPDEGTQQQLTTMLADSDDGIADNLWSADGGPAEVVKIANLLKLTGTQPPDDPNEWGDTLTTPQDMVTVYRYITEQLPSPDRDLILNALSNAPRSASDGFDQYFGIPGGLPRVTWAIKQGWGSSGNQAVLNTTGLLGQDDRYVVIILTSAAANEYSTVPQAVTAGAGALSGLLKDAS
jgi:hypothetical protein